MRIRRIEISRFRGIKSLDWIEVPSVAFLVGPGDSCKTTILDAIELALSPRWAVQFDDADFYACDPCEPLSITLAIGDLSEELVKVGKFGLRRRGWKAGELVDEPEDGAEPVVVVRLEVSPDLEPAWTLLGPHGDNAPISGTDRERFGVVRIGHHFDRQLAWGRGTALTRLTEKESVTGALAEVARAARGGLDRSKLGKLDAAASDVQDRAKAVGVRAASGFRADLDAAALALTAGGFALHDGDVLVRRAGQGSRRLVAMSMEKPSAPGILLVDEVEMGLEPHRLRRLLKVLRASPGQVLGTTHSAVTVAEVEPSELGVVRVSGGKVTVREVDGSLRAAVRAAPESLLGRKVIVCEGKTELGFCRGLDEAWTAGSQESFAYFGVAIADGGGDSSAPARAMAFRALGYPTALLMDSDTDQKKPEVVAAVEEARKNNVLVIRWEGKTAIEQRFALDLPVDLLVAMAEIAVDDKGLETIRGALQSSLPAGSPKLLGEPASWPAQISEPLLRQGIGNAAKAGAGWFKRVDLGAKLGLLVGGSLDRLAETDVGKKVAELKKRSRADD